MEEAVGVGVGRPSSEERIASQPRPRWTSFSLLSDHAFEGHAFISGGLELPHLDLISRIDSRKTTTDSSKSGRSVLFRVISRIDSSEDFITSLAHAIQHGDSDLIQVIYHYLAKNLILNMTDLQNILRSL